MGDPLGQRLYRGLVTVLDQSAGPFVDQILLGAMEEAESFTDLAVRPCLRGLLTRPRLPLQFGLLP